MPVETLPGIPALAPILARSVVSRKRSGGALPDLSLRVEALPVDRLHLGDYQRICGWSVGDVLPHTYPHVVGFPLQAALMTRPGFPLALAGLVHVENVITVHRTLTAEDALDVTVTATDLRRHPRGRQVDLVTEVTVAGERVWEGRSTYLARGGGAADAERGPRPPAMPVGVPNAQWHLPGDLGRRYAAVSGDVNPIHLFGLTARAMGFPRAIAHGMWTYARTLAALGPRAAGAVTSHVWFRKPVLLPASVDLVVAGTDTGVVAGLRSTRRPGIEHLVLTVDPV